MSGDGRHGMRRQSASAHRRGGRTHRCCKSAFRHLQRRSRSQMGSLHPHGAERAAAGGDCTGDGKKSLPVRQLQPLRDDLARRLEHSMDRPQRAGASVFRERKPAPSSNLEILPAGSTRIRKNGTFSAPGRCSVVMRWAVCSKLVPKLARKRLKIVTARPPLLLRMPNTAMISAAAA